MTTWKDIPGWSCSRIIDLYDEMAKVLKPGAVAVECGVAYGKSLAYLASVLDPGVDILAVDIWQTYQGRETYRDAFLRARSRHMGPEDAARAYVLVALRDNGSAHTNALSNDVIDRYDRIEWVQERSEIVPLYLDFNVDFVFLDDHHEEASVYAEIMAWLPRLKPGGVIAGHDINDHYPGVQRAVEHAMSTWGERVQARQTMEIRPPAPGENGWGGVWVWRMT